MAYLNGKQVPLNVNISGLVNIDQKYNPESENPQSGKAVAEALTGVFSQPSWLDIQHFVRLGVAKDVFPVGYEFVTKDSVSGLNVYWRVVGHDHHAAADSSLEHTMTLQTKCVYSLENGTYKGIQFDGDEYFYYADEMLKSGRYWFGWNNIKYEFTLTNDLPAGSVIGIEIVKNSSPRLRIYDTIYGGVYRYEYTSSTILAGSIALANLNFMKRVEFGSSNYAQSGVRQWLNSGEVSSDLWFKPQTKYDTVPDMLGNTEGFMYGLPADFLNVVKPAVIPCHTNNTFEVDSLDGTKFELNKLYTVTDKFFVLSQGEVYGTYYDDNIRDGEQLEYYKNMSTLAKTTYDAAGVARNVMLRTPILANPAGMKIINTGGNLSGSAGWRLGVAPACIIA